VRCLTRYELDSTRGRKRILNTVTIYRGRLYIVNAVYKCDKQQQQGAGRDDGGSDSPCAVPSPELERLRAATQSFSLLSEPQER
jgi:hypothetical protein